MTLRRFTITIDTNSVLEDHLISRMLRSAVNTAGVKIVGGTDVMWDTADCACGADLNDDGSCPNQNDPLMHTPET